MTERTVRQITDARALAAMAHPLRSRLLDILRVDGPATASVLAQRTDQAVGNVSHHLHVLAGCELIEEVPELARDRRERWWRLVSTAVRWSSEDFAGDPATEAVQLAAASLNLERQAAFVRMWATIGEDERAAWPDGPFSTNHWLRVTDDELAELGREVVALFSRWADREIPDDGRPRHNVFAFAHAVPATP